MIGTSPKLTTTINGINIKDPDNITTTEGAISGGSVVSILPTTLKGNEIKFRVKTSLNAREQILTAENYRDWETDRKSTRLNSSHSGESRMPSSA